MEYFGSKTQNAVRNYQQSRGLGTDGIIGCNTWRSLQEDVVRNRENKYYNRLNLIKQSNIKKDVGDMS